MSVISRGQKASLLRRFSTQQSTMLSPQSRLQAVAQRKQDERLQRIPPEWRLAKLPPAHVKNYVDIPRSCGLLSKQDLRITEDFDATSLAEAISKGELSCVQVAEAFCKVRYLYLVHRFKQKRSLLLVFIIEQLLTPTRERLSLINSQIV